MFTHARGTIGILISCLLLGAGCATKNYVRQTMDPLQGKVDQLSDQQKKQGDNLDLLSKDVEANEVAISATREKLGTVEGRTDQALSRGEQNERALNELRSLVANLDDYQVAHQATVLFGFDRDGLTAEATQSLDEVAARVAGMKRYFVTVQGFTDRIGSDEYNYGLSRRRADQVVRYLVGQQNLPVQRIFVVGLGENKPVEDVNTREARARNRRVEVVVYSAGQP